MGAYAIKAGFDRHETCNAFASKTEAQTPFTQQKRLGDESSYLQIGAGVSQMLNKQTDMQVSRFEDDGRDGDTEFTEQYDHLDH